MAHEIQTGSTAYEEVSIATVDLVADRLVSQRRVLAPQRLIRLIAQVINNNPDVGGDSMGSDGSIWFVASQAGRFAPNGFRDDIILALDPATDRVISPIDVGQFATIPQFPANGGAGYLLTGIEKWGQGMMGTANVASPSCTLERIDVGSVMPVAEVPLLCDSLSVSPDGGTAFVCGDGEILPVVTASGRLGASITLPDQASICAGSFVSRNGLLMTFDNFPANGYVDVGVLNVTTDRVEESILIPSGSSLVALVGSPTTDVPHFSRLISPPGQAERLDR